MTVPATAQAITLKPLIKAGDVKNISVKGYDLELDGNIMVFVSEDSPDTLWSMDINGGLPSLIQLLNEDMPIPQGFGNFNLYTDSVQLVGNTVFLKAAGTKQFGIYSVPARGGAISMLLNEKTPLPDGKGLVYGYSGNTYFKASPSRLLITQYIDGKNSGKIYIMNAQSNSTLIPFAPSQCNTSYFPFQFETNVQIDISKDNMILAKQVDSKASPYGYALIAGFIDDFQNSTFCFEPLNSPLLTIHSNKGFRSYINSNSQIDGGTIVFTNYELSGLYSSIATPQGQQLHKLVDDKTPIPEGTRNFGISPSYSLSGNNVVIEDGDGLYLIPTTGGSVTKIIAKGDILDGDKQVDYVRIGKHSLSGNHLVFYMSYTDKKGNYGYAYYLATLFSDSAPAPQNCLMNWAETTYPGLFSPAASTQTLAPYTYRYYKNSNAYLGISSADNHVYYLGADGVLKDAGDLAGWLTKANCQ